MRCFTPLFPLLFIIASKAHFLLSLSISSVGMTHPVQRRQAIYPSFTSAVTRYSSLLGVPSTHIIFNLLPVHPYLQANERTESKGHRAIDEKVGNELKRDDVRVTCMLLD